MDKESLIIGIIYTISGALFTASATINFLNPSVPLVVGFLHVLPAILFFALGIKYFCQVGKNR